MGDLFKREHKTGEYKKVNPFKEIPAEWYPKEPRARSSVDLYIDWHASNIGSLTKYNYVKLGLSQTSLEEAKKTSEEALKTLEEVFLNRHKFVASNDHPTIADLALAWQLYGLGSWDLEFSDKVKEYQKFLEK